MIPQEVIDTVKVAKYHDNEMYYKLKTAVQNVLQSYSDVACGNTSNTKLHNT